MEEEEGGWVVKGSCGEGKEGPGEGDGACGLLITISYKPVEEEELTVGLLTPGML